MCPIGHKSIYCIIALRRICVALYRRYGEVHRLVVDGMRVVVELVADDDVISCIKNVVVVVVVRDVVVNEVRRDVALDVVHFGGEVGHPGRCTCRRTRHRRYHDKTMRAREADTMESRSVSVSEAIEIKNKSYEATQTY